MRFISNPNLTDLLNKNDRTLHRSYSLTQLKTLNNTASVSEKKTEVPSASFSSSRAEVQNQPLPPIKERIKRFQQRIASFDAQNRGLPPLPKSRFETSELEFKPITPASQSTTTEEQTESESLGSISVDLEFEPANLSFKDRIKYLEQKRKAPVSKTRFIKQNNSKPDFEITIAEPIQEPASQSSTVLCKQAESERLTPIPEDSEFDPANLSFKERIKYLNQKRKAPVSKKRFNVRKAGFHQPAAAPPQTENEPTTSIPHDSDFDPSHLSFKERIRYLEQKRKALRKSQ